MLVVGRETPPGAVANREFGVAAYEVLDEETPSWGEIGDEELERLRIHAGTPRFGREIDERVLPAEAGLDRTAIDFEKGCYPGQEPIARQHYRGRVNRGLRSSRSRETSSPTTTRNSRMRARSRPGHELRLARTTMFSPWATSGSRCRATRLSASESTP